MSTAATVLIAIAKELAKQAQDNLPNLQKGESVQREWLENGIYYRESSLDGVTYTRQFNFKHKKKPQKRD